ncbi:MAG: hypothetical protein ACTSX1_05105 [Candidatus Heimdallarchaeaceae archaeon]
MIITYPMLISSSVSPNVIPGLTKAIEKYILVYNIDKVLRAANLGVGKIVKAAGSAVNVGIKVGSGGTLSMRESIEPLFEEDPVKPGQRGGSKTGIEIKTSGAKGPPPRLEIPKDSVSLEPTWIHVTTERKGLQILGVKVIPFRVQSSENIVNIIMSDQKLKGLDYLAAKYSRVGLRVMMRFLRAIRIPMIKDKALTGDPKYDLLWGGTQYGSDMFVALSQLDLDGAEEIFSKPGVVRRIHKLGWASMVITDDVNKKATFCMREFGGVCSVVPYQFIYSSLGKDHAKVYDDLEDVKRTASPFFSMRTNRRKVFGETVAHHKLLKYLDTVQEDNVDESFISGLKKKASSVAREVRKKGTHKKLDLRRQKDAIKRHEEVQRRMAANKAKRLKGS